MKTLTLIFVLLTLVSCQGKQEGEENRLLFISFQEGTYNFYGHYSKAEASPLTREEYFSLRKTTKIYERPYNSPDTASQYENEVREFPENVWLCYDRGEGGLIDLECRQGLW